jgi:hypothetical protein
VSLQVANRQITAPMSQTWVNSLRDLLAEFISTASYYAYHPEKLTDEPFSRLSALHNNLTKGAF